LFSKSHVDCVKKYEKYKSKIDKTASLDLIKVCNMANSIFNELILFLAFLGLKLSCMQNSLVKLKNSKFDEVSSLLP